MHKFCILRETKEVFLDIEDKISFWDLIKKSSVSLDCMDIGILFGIIQRKTYRKIADDLNISQRTIYNRRKKIRRIMQRTDK